MPALLLFLPILWIIVAAGRQAAAWLRLPQETGRSDRSVIGFALGLALLAYGMLALGLLRAFFPPAAIGLLLVLAIVGGREHLRMVADLRAWRRSGLSLTSWGWGAALLFLAFALVALSGVYTPPTLVEWDSVAYHLADPKLYIQAHRIYYIPWEDHSNFAFNLEMCYTLGLLLKSVPLAKLFQFSCAVGLILVTYRLGSDLFSPKVGLWGALLLAATPVIFWEAGTAYVDLPVAFYATLTLLALIRGLRERSERWIGLGAVLMGLTLSTKGTALGVLALLAIGLLIGRLSVRQGVGKSLGLTALWCSTALIVGSPWYIKSWIYTHNPVYPFFYPIFGGRYWSAAAAAAYDGRNASFGAGHTLACLLITPWNLIMALLPGHRPITTLSALPQYWMFNDYQTPLMTLSPILAAVLFFPVFLAGRVPKAVKALSAYVLVSWLFWFVTAQHIRYLLPILPVLCLLSAWTLDQALASGMLAGKMLLGLTAVSIAFSLFLGTKLLQQQLPVNLGTMPRDEYIARGFTAYPAIQFINHALPAGTKVVFYGNPLGFYCDKPYLWGEPGHSVWIPYSAIHSAEDLRLALRARGVTHILINTRGFSFGPDAKGYPGFLYRLTVDAGPPVFGDPSDPQQHVFVYALPTRPPVRVY